MRDLRVAKNMEAAMQATCDAAAIILSSERATVATKGFFGDFLTAADQAASRAIVEKLHSIFPEDGILSEEEQECVESSNGWRWLIDPIDGTAIFATGSDPRLVAIMIALEFEGELKFSLVHFPYTEEVFYSVAGVGAFLNGKQFTVAEGRSLSDIVVGLNPYSDSRYETPEFVKLWNGLRAAGGPMLIHNGPPNSAMGIWAVSPLSPFGAHIHDFNPAVGKQCIWDIAPVLLIVKEAGGVFFNRQGEWIDHRKPEFAVVAESREIAEAILALTA